MKLEKDSWGVDYLHFEDGDLVLFNGDYRAFVVGDRKIYNKEEVLVLENEDGEQIAVQAKTIEPAFDPEKLVWDAYFKANDGKHYGFGTIVDLEEFKAQKSVEASYKSATKNAKRSKKK